MTLILESASEQATIEALRQQYETAPNSKLFMPLAEQLRRRGCYSEAIELCNRAKSAHPSYISCRVLLGRCLLELGMRREALQEFEEVLELDRENAFSLSIIADLHKAQGRLRDASNYYRALLRINPSDKEIQQKLSEVMKLLEPLDEELGIFSRFEEVGIGISGDGGAESDVSTMIPGKCPDRIKFGVSPIEQAGKICLRKDYVDPTREFSGKPAHFQPPRDLLQTQVESPDSIRLSRRAAAAGSDAGSKPRPEMAPSRDSFQFFSYTNRCSDFSKFTQWLETNKPGVSRGSYNVSNP